MRLGMVLRSAYMSEGIDAYYERELDRIYTEAESFARQRGKIAGRLLLGSRGSRDPHVERLLQGFAYIAAGIRERLDEDFPLLTETLLSSLHPHLLRPRPSMAVVKLSGSKAISGVPGGYAVPAGRIVTAVASDGSERRFVMRYPVFLYPLDVTEATILPVPPDIQAPFDAVTMLKVRVTVNAQGETFGSLGVRSLRFHLNTPRHIRSALYGFLFTPSSVEISFIDPETGEETKAKPLTGGVDLHRVGFADSESMLPYAPSTLNGYRLLADYFSFPEKFCFFDLDNIPAGAGATEMVIRVFGGRIPQDMTVEANHFLLGCTPIANLFEHNVQFTLTHEQPEYRLSPSVEAGAGCRLYSVDKVVVTPTRGSRQFEMKPFFPFRAVEPDEETDIFYLVRRRGEETYLAFADIRTGHARWEAAQLSVSTTCFHGPSAASIPPRAVFSMPGQNVIETVTVISEPTRPVFPDSGHEAHWRLMSHLVLNHLSLSGGKSGAGALREILRLYDWDGSQENRSRIGSIRSIESRKRIFLPDAANADLAGCFLGGLEIDVELRDDTADDALFASILEAFIAGHAALNTPLAIRVGSDLPGGKEWRFQTRMGTRRSI